MSAFSEAARELESLSRRVEQLEALMRASRRDVPERTAYKVSEVAALIGRAPKTVRRMIEDGRLSAEDMGGWYAVPRSEVERLGRAS